MCRERVVCGRRAHLRTCESSVAALGGAASQASTPTAFFTEFDSLLVKNHGGYYLQPPSVTLGLGAAGAACLLKTNQGLVMTDQITSDSDLFARVRRWKDFRLQAQHLFPTESALRWFIRQHEQALVNAGVLLTLPRGHFVDPIPFQAVAINIMRQLTKTERAV